MLCETSNATNDAALADLLPGERLYQQFSVRAHWSEATERTDLGPGWTKDLPPGRQWNGVTIERMYRESTTLEQAEDDARLWWPKYLAKNPKPDICDLTLSATYKQSEVWVISWFSHWTFDVGLSDRDVLESFERFVRRMENRIRRETYRDGDGIEHSPYCLMGAEDRYRWRGRAADGSPDPDSPPPCRCVQCKEQGVLRIDH
jgi:hypothetical protein